MAATAGLTFMAVQTISTFASQRREARARKQQGAFEKAAYDRNAQLADLQAVDALARGELSAQQLEQQSRLDSRSAIGSLRTGFAGQGVVLDAGSALDVQDDTARNIARVSALDAATIRNNAAREAWGFTTQAETSRFQGAMAAAGADAAAAGMRANSYNTLITGAANTYGLYRKQNDNTKVKSVTPKLIRRGVDVVPMTPGRGSV